MGATFESTQKMAEWARMRAQANRLANERDMSEIHGSPGVLDVAACSAIWLPASQPPSGMTGYWSRDVLVLMKSGEVSRLAYFWAADGKSGVWQRKMGTGQDDFPALWTELPNAGDVARGGGQHSTQSKT